jgi:hypothetical protein
VTEIPFLVSEVLGLLFPGIKAYMSPSVFEVYLF